ncbi:hypothetical protein [Winogradskyella arenosi]|uniref:Helix-turn-helix protein n=1 Tax=Winogradskyella arenosi TaxID=533325 RepID=A0A368ZL68_9FLAO|nr:hypothetical protein [Winogradskyella arenosi]RCW93635.1 hypothetical protein DFQ08_101432 [Winogradskyella arenosi]
MGNKGFIMLYRELTEWEWYTDINTFKVFTHCLLKVNYSKKRWQGILIQKGEFITSYEKLAIETGLTISKVRTALGKLKSTGYISVQTTVSYTKITVLQLNRYVAETTIEINTPFDKHNDKHNDTPNNNLIASQSQTYTNQITTTNTNNKNSIKKRKKRFREQVYSHSHFNSKILDSFYNYWSELNLEKTKMRFETERFFEFEMRLKKWKDNERPKNEYRYEKSELLTNRPTKL